MQTDEALKILNIESENLSHDVVTTNFKKYYDLNDPSKGGSFYLQSKIYRAKEALENDLVEKRTSQSATSSSESGDGCKNATDENDRKK